MKKLLLSSLIGCASMTQAAVLVGMGDHLPMPSLPSNTPSLHFCPNDHSVADSMGHGAPPPLAAWHGTFTATGAQPMSYNSGSNSWNFSGLFSSQLPAGSIFTLSDLDEGASNTITFKAYDSSGAPLSHWLEEPSATFGTGQGLGDAINLTDIPSWEWNATSFTYIFHGGTIPSNPTIALYLNSNQRISILETNKDSTSNNFAIYAPALVPEPTSVFLLGVGALALISRRKRHSAS